MNKFTYGKTPAAIYLAEYMNENSTVSDMRKVASVLTNFSRTINEIEESNLAGLMSVHVIGGLIPLLRNRVQNTVINGDSGLITMLVRNIMQGRLKDLIRRARKVRIFEHQNATSFSQPTIALGSVYDSISSAKLIERSTARLKRLNKVNTLY